MGSRGHTGRVYTRGVHGWKERARTGIVRRGRDVITRRLALRGQLERGELADGVVDVAALLQDGGHVLYRVRGWECLRQYACRMLNGADPRVRGGRDDEDVEHEGVRVRVRGPQEEGQERPRLRARREFARARLEAVACFGKSKCSQETVTPRSFG